MTRRTVKDEEGVHYIVEKQSSESSRVRDPETGEQRYIPNDELEPVAGESPLETAASGVPEDVRTLLTAVHDDRTLGLLVELERTGPLSVRTLLDAYDICESDLHGTLAELQLAGLIDETRVTGERGYETTETAHNALDTLDVTVS